MIITAKPLQPSRRPLDTLLLFAFEDQSRPAGSWKAIDPRLDAAYKAAAARENFKAKEKTSLTFYPSDARPAARVVVAGLGKRAQSDAERLRRAAATAAQRCRAAAAPEVFVLLPGTGDVREQVQSVGEGFRLALYDFDKYKSKRESNGAPDRVHVLADRPDVRADVAEGVRRAEIFSTATCLARDLVNEPANRCTPRHLADVARGLARGDRSIRCRVYDERQIARMKMGGLLGVAAGSEEPPRFVHLTYAPPGARRTLAIVGKGITFDSGGLCIKPADGMLHMKDDMGGAAAVLGLFRGLRELRPRIGVHGIFAATENMPGGRAYKTRDVLRAMNGKTMEIVNTDAEGRVILSDALSYASRLKPDEIIDLATLTGACVVALGPQISGIFGTDRELVDRLIDAGRATGEKIWPLPLEEEYGEMIRSDVADLKNSGGRYGGSITAALFLKEFVDPKIPWAHIDIAGPCLSESAGPYRPPGGTGVMVRTLLRYLESRAG